MATFIMLGNFTEQGIRTVQDTTKRADAFKEQTKNAGVTLRDVYWTLGSYDIVAICEADDDASAAAALMKLASQGNVRTQTLRAFSRDEMQNVLSKMR